MKATFTKIATLAVTALALNQAQATNYFTLIEAGSSTASFIGGANDSIHFIGKMSGATVAVTTNNTGVTNDCGLLADGVTVDTNYPAAGTYNAHFMMFLDSTNAKAARIPLSAYVETGSLNPGVKFGGWVTEDSLNICEEDDSAGTTHYFFKVQMTGQL